MVAVALLETTCTCISLVLSCGGKYTVSFDDHFTHTRDINAIIVRSLY